jgi:hypothetical protein
MTRPYQAALREAKPRPGAVDGLRGLYDLWLKALADLKWKPGETDDQYKERIARPYAVFHERADFVRTAMVSGGDTAVAGSKPAAGKSKTVAAAAAPAKAAR